MKWPTAPYFVVVRLLPRGRFMMACLHKHRSYRAARRCQSTYDPNTLITHVYYHRGVVPAEWKGMR